MQVYIYMHMYIYIYMKPRALESQAACATARAAPAHSRPCKTDMSAMHCDFRALPPGLQGEGQSSRWTPLTLHLALHHFCD